MEKLNFRDISFLIPVRIDSADRIENLEIIVQYLCIYFNTTIQVTEVDQQSLLSKSIKESICYNFQKSHAPVFQRTKINNHLIHSCRTEIAVLYDADIIIPPLQLLNAAECIRKKQAAFALPYDGHFLQVDYYNKKMFKENLDIDFLESGVHLYTTDTHHSVGGCFMFRINEYKKCGMENENIEGWGHDDAERVKRLQKLGYAIFRSPGALYHLWHERKENSYFFDKGRAIKSFENYFKTCSITKEALQQEIAIWPWMRQNIP
jgi:predicted glycosyltransferase involved in capsule biosynthesis